MSKAFANFSTHMCNAKSSYINIYIFIFIFFNILLVKCDYFIFYLNIYYIRTLDNLFFVLWTVVKKTSKSKVVMELNVSNVF